MALMEKNILRFFNTGPDLPGVDWAVGVDAPELEALILIDGTGVLLKAGTCNGRCDADTRVSASLLVVVANALLIVLSSPS